MTNEQIAAAWTYIQSTSLHHCHHHCVFNFLYCLSTFSWIKPDSSRWLLPYVHFTANVKAEWNVTLFCPVWKLTHTGICWQAWFSDLQGSLSKTAQEYRRGVEWRLTCDSLRFVGSKGRGEDVAQLVIPGRCEALVLTKWLTDSWIVTPSQHEEGGSGSSLPSWSASPHNMDESPSVKQVVSKVKSDSLSWQLSQYVWREFGKKLSSVNQ